MSRGAELVKSESAGGNKPGGDSQPSQANTPPGPCGQQANFVCPLSQAGTSCAQCLSAHEAMRAFEDMDLEIVLQSGFKLAVEISLDELIIGNVLAIHALPNDTWLQWRAL